MKSLCPNIESALLAAIMLTLLAMSAEVRAADAAFAAALRAKGVEVTEAAGEITGLSLKTKVELTHAEAQQIRQLDHLKSFSCGLGFDEALFAALKDSPELETFSSNGMDVSDEGLRALGACKKLKTIAFFHPGKRFHGVGFTALAELPELERLTVAGSAEINDDGMAAIAKLKHLKEFRIWHAGATAEGIRKLGALTEIRSLTIGQRLANTPPAGLTDDAVAALAGCSSLESLTLQEARLTLPALSQLQKLPRLKKLALDGIDVSESDVEALKRQLPQTGVKWTAPNEAATKRITALFGPR